MKYLFFYLSLLIVTPLLKPQENNKWINFLTSNDIQCSVKEDSILWVGTTGGLIKYNYLTGTYLIFDKIDSGLPHHNIKSIVIDSMGNKWLGSWGGGVIKYNNEIWEVFNQENSEISNDFIEAVTIDNSGNLWIAPNYMGITKFDGVNWISYNDSSVLGSSDVSYLNVDKSGQLWVATRSGGVTRYDGVNWQTYAPYNSQVPGYNIKTIFVDDSNYVWVGTTTGGMAKFDGNDWIVYTDGGFITHVTAITRDASGIMWIGTKNYGVFKYDFLTWTSFFNSPIPSKKINSIITIDGSKKWIGSEKGIATYDDINWTVIQFQNLHLLSNEIINLESDNIGNTYLATDFAFPIVIKFYQNQFEEINAYTLNPFELEIDGENNIWIANLGTGSGKYDGFEWTYYNKYNSGLTNEYVLCIYPDGDSLVWFGTYGGLFKFNGNSWLNYSTMNSPLVSDNVSAIVRDKNGVLWIGQIPKTIGGMDGGIFRIDGNEWTWFNYYNSSLSSNRVINLKVDNDNNVWVVTQPCPTGFEDLGGGITCIKNNGSWTVYDTTNSQLETNWVTDLAIDNEKNVYVSTKPIWRGPINTSEYYGGGIYIIKDSIVQLINTRNSSLTDNHVNAVSVDIFNNKWFGTRNGISVYNENGIVTGMDGGTVLNENIEYQLLQNYPNPFNPITKITYQLSKQGKVSLKVYDILGREVATLVDELKDVGAYEVYFNASSIASGVYFYMLQVNDFRNTKKMILLK